MGRTKQATSKQKKSKTSNQPPSTSSSQNPIPTRKNALEGKSGNLSKKLFCKDYWIKSSDLEGSTIQRYLVERKLWNYACTKMVTNPSIALFFYKHFTIRYIGHKWQYEINLERGPSRIFTSDEFNTTFGYEDDNNEGFCKPDDISKDWWPDELVRVGIDGYAGAAIALNNIDDWGLTSEEISGAPKLKYFKGNDKLLLSIVKNILLPLNTKDNQINYPHTALLLMIKNHIHINLPCLIRNHMIFSTTNHSSDYLPYGGFITEVIMKKMGLDVEVDPTLVVPKSIHIGRQTWMRQYSVRYGDDYVLRWEVPFMSDEEFDNLKNLVGKKRTKGKETAQDGSSDDDDDGGEEMSDIGGHLAIGGSGDPPRASRSSRRASRSSTGFDHELLMREIHEQSERQRAILRGQEESRERQLAIMKEQGYAKKRQSKMKGFLKIIASACNCKDVDIAQFEHSSPEP